MNAVDARAISWDELVAGRWTRTYTKCPCARGLRAVGRRWPGWRLGEPPTWADFVTALEIDADDRRWLVARVLLRNRRLLVTWAVDCAEAVVHLAGASEAEIRAEVIEPLRAWIAGDDTIDLRAVRSRAWAIYDSTAYTAIAVARAYRAARAADVVGEASATEAPDAQIAIDVSIAVASDVYGDTDEAMLRLAIPHLAAASDAVSDIR